MIFLIADWTGDPGAGTRRLAGVAGLHPLAAFRQCRLHSFREAGPDPANLPWPQFRFSDPGDL